MYSRKTQNPKFQRTLQPIHLRGVRAHGRAQPDGVVLEAEEVQHAELPGLGLPAEEDGLLWVWGLGDGGELGFDRPIRFWSPFYQS